jgi:hypothetical protein
VTVTPATRTVKWLFATVAVPRISVIGGALMFLAIVLSWFFG